MAKLNDRIDALRAKERARLSTKLDEARGNYRDTGYNRYWNQIERCEAQIAEIDGAAVVSKATLQMHKDDHRKHLQQIRDKVAELAAEEPLNIEFKTFRRWLENYLEHIWREC